MIENGRVAVNGRIAKLGDQADPEKQRITLDGVPIRRQEEYVYIMLNKPRGYLSTTDDPHGRRTVLELVDVPQRLYPVGRLDADSQGLLLLTNDGALTQNLTHPRYGHARVYRVMVSGDPTDETLERWRKGITLDGKLTRFDKIQVERRERDTTWLRVTLHEGRKHLVRRITGALGHTALRLIRVQMGPLSLGDLPSGQWRPLIYQEVQLLKQEVGIAEPQEKADSRSAAPRRKPSRSPRR